MSQLDLMAAAGAFEPSARERRDNPAFVRCPECAVPASVLDRFNLDSTDGLVPHVEVHCMTGHHFMMPDAGLQQL